MVDHDLTPGGRVTYYMTSPEGERYAGYWLITAVDAPRGLSFDDDFAHDDLTPNPQMPVSKDVYTFTAHDGGTRVTYASTYPSAEALQQVLDMGMVEGATGAINQIDGFVAA
ncbi:SRPBCC family protein [Micromonospora craniellae]|uniref:SRPBCC family protein n=1 Tax=Micromonospora craniellae TaxID=2294034 RepID=UPI0018F19DF2|nr:SRPBCC domain-containing protein [Micromonospora craniellae]